MPESQLKTTVVLLLLVISTAAGAQSSDAPQPVPMPNTELRRFHSGIMDQDFRIYVQLPLDYVIPMVPGNTPYGI